MTKLRVVNLTNSPFDLEGGLRLPAMGNVTGEFSDEYAAQLRASPGVDVRASHDPTPGEKPAAVRQRKKRSG